MNSQGFSFPPPPPPPPQQQPQHATYPPQYGQGSYGQRGGRSAGGHHNRGRGRGYGNRGGGNGGRGGHYNASSAAPSPVGFAPMNYSGYASPAYPTPPQAGTPQFNAPRPQGFQSPPHSAPFVAPQTYSHPTPRHGPPYQHQQGYEAATYVPPTAQPTPAYPPVLSNPQHAQAAQPPMMGPPMRWGFENGAPTGSFPGPPRGNQRGPRHYNNTYGNQTSMGGNQVPHTTKRDHKSAFGKPQSVGPRVPAPPPVPSFGNPLPSKPPPPADATRKPKKKKRKHNQLGLTPKAEEHESSEEEDDVDEESKLTAGGGAGPTASLSITYRGRTSTLQSPADIAAWIEERKKRFPTQARVEEKKRAMEEAKKAREEAMRQRQEMKRAQKEAQAPKEKAHPTANPVDEAAKAKQKADKLRRKLLKEQKRVEKAEADAERARMKVEELQRATSASQQSLVPPSPGSGQDRTPDQEAQASVSQDKQSEPVSAEASAASAATLPEVAPESKSVDTPGVQDNGDLVISTSDLDSSDWTSSSGSDAASSSSESDSDGSDDDSAPEQVTSRREGPERVAPPPREGKKRICRHFARNGRCQRGENCKFLHEKPEKPERGPKSKPQEKPGRQGLLQALLGRQKQDEDRQVMDVIVWMGENGLLEPKPESRVSLENGVVNGPSGMDGVEEAIITVDNNETQAIEGAEEPAPEQRLDDAGTNS
ncbi:hypothetical protein FE257_007731 [Aspergillus nanangensis]|uniref:C3H1-type domain-containing protein n=1 Tax=Aspergillus nanangensis TaxID=2582783 RepID=A0AAD4CWX2_ASPNN|nr:hypothetical protein FE257_007731 [Aspergillus nanangensis]